MFNPRNIASTVREYRWVLSIIFAVSACLSIAHRLGAI